MTRLRTLIVDDEELACRGLALRLAGYVDVEVCGTARNGREALEAVRSMRPDVIMLDIQMPGMSGFDVLERLAGPEMPAVIFVTAYDRFAIRAFEASALDYLLKPIDEDRLADAVGRARRRIARRRVREHRDRLLRLVCELSGRELTLDAALQEAGPAGRPYPRRLTIRDGRETTFVPVDSIDWVDAAGDYMCVHAEGRTWVMRGTMKSLEGLLDPADFVRIHRSAIVNRHRVAGLRAHRNGEYFVTLSVGEELKLSRGYRANVYRLQPPS
jgi:two-component system LytT family response regulator